MAGDSGGATITTAGATASTQAEDAARLLAMINGAWMCQAIATACELGVPDRLREVGQLFDQARDSPEDYEGFALSA